MCRFFALPAGVGPRILRSREGLSAAEPGQADGDSALVLRTMLLVEVASEGLRAKKGCNAGIKNAKLFFGLEHPEDFREFLDEPEARHAAQSDLQGLWPAMQ